MDLTWMKSNISRYTFVSALLLVILTQLAASFIGERNANIIFWLAIIVFSLALMVRGIFGIKDRRITPFGGEAETGNLAVLESVLHILIGIALLLLTLYMMGVFTFSWPVVKV